MTLRRMLLGLSGAVAVSGMAVAAPPGGHLSEGRELDPVARDYYLTTPAPAAEAAPAREDQTPGDMFGWSLFADFRETILNELTIPLGTVPPRDS